MQMGKKEVIALRQRQKKALAATRIHWGENSIEVEKAIKAGDEDFSSTKYSDSTSRCECCVQFGGGITPCKDCPINIITECKCGDSPYNLTPSLYDDPTIAELENTLLELDFIHHVWYAMGF